MTTSTSISARPSDLLPLASAAAARARPRNENATVGRCCDRRRWMGWFADGQRTRLSQLAFCTWAGTRWAAHDHGLLPHDGRSGELDPPPHGAGFFAGDDNASPPRCAASSSVTPTRIFSAGNGGRWRRRALGWSLRPHVARLFRNLHENGGEVWRQKITARP